MRVMAFASAETKPDLVSRGIMAFLKTNYSHVGMLVDVDARFGAWLELVTGKPTPPGRYLFHAVGEGVVHDPVEPFLADHTFVHMVDLTPYLAVSTDQIIGFLAGAIGREYSESQYIGVLLPAIAKYFVNGNEKAFCSEFAAQCAVYFTSIPRSVFTSMQSCDFVTPKDFVERLLEWVELNPVPAKEEMNA